MSDSAALRGPWRRGAHRRHPGVHPQAGPSCTWCRSLGARGGWELLALTCLPQLVGRWSGARSRPTAPAR